MSEERLEGKFIFLVSTPFSLVVDICIVSAERYRRVDSCREVSE